MDLKDILIKLISFRTLTDNYEEHLRAFQWIKNQLKGLPVYIRYLESKRSSSLIITTRKTKTPVLWLAAHLDVVDGSKDCFKPIVKNGKIYGRGAFDMKFAIAVYIKMLRDLGTRELPKLDFGVMITTDEEVGGLNGTKFLIDRGFTSQVCVLPDGGNGWEVQRSAKGVWHLRIQSFGKSAHSSRPWLGENAILSLTEFVRLFMKGFPKEPCGSESHSHSTITVAKIDGGQAVNQIPDHAEAFVDIRFPSEKERKRIAGAMNDLRRKFKNISVETLVYADSYRPRLDSAYLRLFEKIAKDKFGISMKKIDSHGSSDGRFFDKAGIPVILTRPQGGGHHSENEFVDVKDLERFYEVTKEFTERAALR